MKKYLGITNSMRHVCLIDKTILSNRNNRVNNLFYNSNIKNFAGRNNNGRVTLRTKGTRNKRLNRLIDHKRSIYNLSGIIYSIEYDPNRSSFISLVVYSNDIICYILNIHKVTIGSKIISYNTSNSFVYNKGDRNQLLYLLPGSIINSLEVRPGEGAIYIRSAGTYGKLLKKYAKHNLAYVELPSKICTYVSILSHATLGVVSNVNYRKINLGKAGRSRWLGKKSTVRGVAMNPVDHPHGGGEGKKSNPSLKRSPWGRIVRWVNKKEIDYFKLL